MKESIQIFLFVLLSEVVRYIVYLYYHQGPSKEEITLTEQIKSLKKDAAAVSSPSTFAQYAKIKREIDKKERQLSDLSSKRKGNFFTGVFFSIFSYVLRIGVLFTVWLLWPSTATTIPLYYILPSDPDSYLSLLMSLLLFLPSKILSGPSLSTSVFAKSWGLLQVSSFSWCVICQRVISQSISV